jgi:transposase
MEESCPNCKRLEAQVLALQERLAALEALMKRDSRTSHQPPSSDKGRQSIKSERVKSGRKSGGQEGHKGQTLELREAVDKTIVLSVTGRCKCGQGLEAVRVHSHEKRQVHDLPEMKLVVTEYQAERKICPGCHKRHQASFPSEVAGRVQYGSRLQGLVTYLHVGHSIPLQRSSQILGVVGKTQLSEGTLVSCIQRAAERLRDFETKLVAGLQQQAVLHADETGSKVAGKLQWIHVLTCPAMTFYKHHPKRGYAALEAMKVLPEYRGVLLHDAWHSYFQLPALHALCNAHLLRELRALAELEQQGWAGELRVALQGVYHALKTTSLTPKEKHTFSEQFDSLVEQGLAANPERRRSAATRGRIAQPKGRNLALRCQQHKQAILRFLFDDRVPFDNNLAERDIRMVCVKRKVSGGFRSSQGAQAFCRIRSYIATLTKQGLNVWDGLVSIFQGNVLMPLLTS